MGQSLIAHWPASLEDAVEKTNKLQTKNKTQNKQNQKPLHQETL